MEESPDNFIYPMIDEVCEILTTSDPIDWPYELNSQQRQEFLKKLINYYSMKEEYLKCSKLKLILESLID